MHVTSEIFRQGMRNLGGAVNIITTHLDGCDYGLTATAVCSVTAEPPQLLACVNKLGVTYTSIVTSGVLAVNALSRRHVAIAEVFAGMSGNPENDRFHIGDWDHSYESPVLKDALVSFNCRVNTIQDVGTHGIIIADIVDISIGAGEPLFYIDGGFVSSQNIQ